MSSRKYWILAAVAGAALLGVFIWKIQTMQRTIETLEASLREKEAAMKKTQPHSRAAKETPLPKLENPADGDGGKIGEGRGAPTNAASSYQILKALEDDSATDPRSHAEKLHELLANNPTEEEAAIACRFIFNEAADRQDLPDYALQAIYASQSNPDLKRVIAQVLSQRGNDVLLNAQIAEAQATLKSANAKDRLDALNQLGKIHSVRAVDAIAPFLQDSDSTVRVAALFALRDSGNLRHVNLVEPMTSDPDPSVSTLAANVVSTLRNLSSSARTSYSRADIEAELPPIANP